jgi:hypothetical protein
MPAVYLILGLPGAGRHEIVLNLIEGGLDEAQPVTVYLAEGDEPPAVTAPLTARTGVTARPYAWVEDRGFVEPASATEGEADVVFFLADGRASPIDQLEAFPAWLAERGRKLTRILLVVDCTLAAAHPEVSEWHEACAHFADCVLLNRREGVPNAWISAFRRKFAAGFFPCLITLVKQGRVENAPLVLFPEPRRLSLVFDELDPLEDIDEDDEELPDDLLTMENKPDPYFERSPSGQRRRLVPNVRKFLPGGPKP